MALVTDPISAVAGAVQSIVERVVPDPAQQAAAKQALAQMYLTGEIQQMTVQAGVITAETNKGGLNALWRPCLMFVFMSILVNNYILAPYLQAIFHCGLTLPIPSDMWSLLRLGVGGYVMGRSVEKITTPHPVTGVSPIAGAIQSVANTFKGH